MKTNYKYKRPIYCKSITLVICDKLPKDAPTFVDILGYFHNQKVNEDGSIIHEFTPEIEPNYYGLGQFEKDKDNGIRPPAEVEAIHKLQVEHALLVALSYCPVENLPEFKEELKKSIDALFAQFNESAIMERGKNDNAAQH